MRNLGRKLVCFLPIFGGAYGWGSFACSEHNRESSRYYFAGALLCRVFVVGFLWLFPLEGYLNAQDLNSQLLQDISNKVESGFKVSNQSRTDNINTLHQALGYFNTSTTNNTLEEDMAGILGKLEEIKSSISSSSSDGITKEDLQSVFSVWFNDVTGKYWDNFAYWYSNIPTSGSYDLFDLVPNPQYWSQDSFRGKSLRSSPQGIIPLLYQIAKNQSVASIVLDSDLNSILSKVSDIRVIKDYFWGDLKFSSFNEYMDSKVLQLIEAMGNIKLDGNIELPEVDFSVFGYDRYNTQKAFLQTLVGSAQKFQVLSYNTADGYYVHSGKYDLTRGDILGALSAMNENMFMGLRATSQNVFTGSRSIVAAINGQTNDEIWEGEPDTLKDAGANEKIFDVKQEGTGSSSQSYNYTPGLTNDLNVVQVQINENTNKLYNVSSDNITAKYLKNPFGELSSGADINGVEAGSAEVLDFGNGVVIDFGVSYEKFNANVMSKVKEPLKSGFGYLWTFVGILCTGFALRKVVSGGV